MVRVERVALLAVFPVSLLFAAEPAPAGPPSLAVYVYGEDAGATPIAAKLADPLTRAGTAGGWRVVADPRVGDLLDRSPEDLARGAAALGVARTAWIEALEHYSKVRMELAQETLLKARAAWLEAALPIGYDELRNIHLYLGAIAFNQGQTAAAEVQFRQAAFLSPSLALNKETFSPSLVDAFERARKGIPTSAKGGIKVDCDTAGTQIYVDGLPRGGAPRTISDLPEGEHYVELRAPGASAQLQAVEVLAGVDGQLVVTLKKTGFPLRMVWAEGKGDAGAVGIARALRLDRVVLVAVRSTVTGLQPFSARGAAFDAVTNRRVVSSEAALTGPADVAKVAKLADPLLEHPKPRDPSLDRAAVLGIRSRFLDAGTTLLLVESGAAYQDHIFDGHGRYVSAGHWGQDRNYEPDHDFDSYLETRTGVHLRYGIREGLSTFVDTAFFTKELHYAFDEDGDGVYSESELDVRRDDTGMGDTTAGADLRLPSLQVGPLSLVYVVMRAKLPTGAATTAGFLRQYHSLVMGSGQYDLHAGMGAMIGGARARFGAEAGYTERLPDRVWYFNYNRARRYLNPGDEEHLHLDGAFLLGRALSLDAFTDFTHRNATDGFIDAVTHREGKAREMFLLDGGVAIRAEFTEKSQAGVVLQHPMWGKTTTTFFPLDVTGPRLYGYYGIRF